jgi:hypothetical protein
MSASVGLWRLPWMPEALHQLRIVNSIPRYYLLDVDLQRCEGTARVPQRSAVNGSR